MHGWTEKRIRVLCYIAAVVVDMDSDEVVVGEHDIVVVPLKLLLLVVDEQHVVLDVPLFVHLVLPVSLERAPVVSYVAWLATEHVPSSVRHGLGPIARST
jgi:hypothetical protein